MNIKDRVYGNVEISEPVLLEIINSPTLQRLKDIDQAGYFEPHFSGTRHSRFEHSVGVCSLLKNYGAPIEEQIAGLIHDVSHSAFSHCIDYVLDVGSEKEHNHQDNVFDEFVRKSEIPEILKKYNLDLDYILDDQNFPLKEKDLPDLCADRIDYSLRTATVFKEIENGKYFIKIVLEKIEQHIKTDSKLSLLFDRMNNKIGFRNDPSDYTGKVFCKSRVVNPLCKHDGKIMRVSEVNPSWNDIIKQESEPKEYFLKF